MPNDRAHPPGRATEPRSAPHLGRAAGWTLLLAAAIATWGACSKSLDSLAPFPCAKDGSCPDGFTCQSVSGGMACAAAISCTGAQVPCNGSCIDPTQDDPMNCGGCGIACTPGETCCNHSCAALSTDAMNCGTCGKVCGGNATCQAGACKCAPGQPVCAGVCADTQTDPNNCGACGKSCGSNGCAGGACTSCPPMMTQCNGTCVYTEGDPSNCGTCGNVCPSPQPCSAGQCGPIPCGSTTGNTCNNTSWVIHCDPTSNQIVCCAPTNPFYCGNTAPGDCWNVPIDCTKAIMCSDGQWHGCLPGQTYDCTSMMCM